ncbi:MAG: mandelate racemase/muconate lactonizing enzyme family protein [Synergistaceae bacterium]|jgi:galactonate dehydratase|nr:mandelate racemase/muconate lactonizing enzyme family protein [Synergistaceae bacterium]
MKITSVKPYLIFSGWRRNWLFIKIETDEGITGWGEGYTFLDRDYSVMHYVEELSNCIIGRDPFNIKSFTYFAYVDFAKKRGSLDFYAAVSGIEMALWDIAGKALKAPIHRLMGGVCRDKLRLYLNGWGAEDVDDLGELSEKAQQAVAQGFTALKLDPLPPNWSMFLSREEEQYTIDRIRTVREAVGPNVDLLMDAHRRMSAYDTVNLARRLQEFDLYWYEEPVSSKNIELLAKVKSEIKQRVVTGEELYTKAEFRRVFELGAADVINPDPCNCGGLLELREIAAMAEAYYISVTPHNCYNMSWLAMAASGHVCAAMPNFLIAEYFNRLDGVCRDLFKDALVIKDGDLYLPDRPGVGMEINEEFLLKSSYKHDQRRAIHEFF